mmetsp:Transcript_6755/g.14885  ORF Transcript_6755/g.14885 Transcript_6755/m.14885 type:complete len:135 (+) Transcript_6755:175-579(+)
MKMPHNGRIGTNGARNRPCSLHPLLGHFVCILLPMNNVAEQASIVAKLTPLSDTSLDKRILRRNPERNEDTMNVATSRGNKCGLLRGLVLRTIITLMSVIVKAISIPDEIRSSKCLNGTKVAITVINSPLIFNP